MADKAISTVIIVDTHVHWYADALLSELLNIAWENAEHAANQAGKKIELCVLFLVDTATQDSAQRLQREPMNDWQVMPNNEDESSALFESGRRLVLLVFGQQIVTAERLEVLAIGSTQRVPDGLLLTETVMRSRSHAPITILPWAFGKWWGGRGSKAMNVIMKTETGVYAGDNGIRPRLSPRPKILRTADNLGVKVLAGTDPLPVENDIRRCGSYALGLEQPVDRSQPWFGVRDSILNHDDALVVGKRATWREFFRCQLALRMR